VSPQRTPTELASQFATEQALSSRFPIFGFDMSAQLPPDWKETVDQCVDEYAVSHTLSGDASTSREKAMRTSTPLDVPARALVADGLAVRQSAPWLDELFRGEFLQMANSLGTTCYECAHDVPSGVNINVIPPRSRYEWHVDSNPLTGLLFLSEDHNGGDLVFRSGDPSDYWTVRVTPVVGKLLLFDAREVAHTVEPLDRGESRISAPMNFYLKGEPQVRPNDLDAYLYGDSEG